MGDAAKNFLTQFYTLPGTTLKEKHQNLFRLLHQNLSLRETPEVLDYIAEHLVPNNHLERIFRVDFLVYFHRFNELYEDFKNGDEITIRKVSKHEWFFQRAFKGVVVEDFVNQILPTTSYSLKLKILKKLPVEGQQADEFFNAICKRYGLFLATNVLLKCSSDKIREVIKTQPVKLTVTQLQSMYEKDPELMYTYFEERTKHKGDSSFLNHNPILIYIAQRNPKMFSDLFNKYKFDTGLGRRTTKRFIDSQKEDVLKKPGKYLTILNKAATIRKLGSEMTGVLFEKSLSGRDENWRSLMKHYPKKKRYCLLKRAHNAVYRQKMGENLEEVSEEILEMMDDSDEREHYAKLKIEKDENENYLKYVKPDYCLKKFMEKVNHMKSPERAKYVGIAIYCCILNKDLEHLLKVCELVCVRFKNDDRAVRESFFRYVTDNVKFLAELTEEHWKLIMEIFATSKAKSERISSEHDIIASYAKFLIDNDKPLKEISQKKYDWHDIFWYSELAKDPKFFKPLMSEVIEVGLIKPDPDDELDAARYDCILASIYSNYNERNPTNKLDIRDHPRIRKSVKQMLETDTSSYVDNCRAGVQYLVCQPVQTEEVKELKKLYFKAFKSFGSFSGLMWFLKHDPKSLLDNYDEFLNNFIEGWDADSLRVWRIVKKYSHLEMDKKTVEFCKSKLKEEFEEKKELIRPLTMLSSSSDHLEFIKPYIPTADKVDFTNDEAKEMYSIQGKLFRMLHFVNDPRKVLPIAYELCRGDYLQFARHPLYSCFYKLPENETKQYVDKLDATKAVSVKKHAMNVSCVIYDADTVYNCLKSATVPSLGSTLKYFAKNPSGPLWELLNNKISSLEKKKLQQLKTAIGVPVPFEYKSQFVELIWNVLDKYENKEFKKVLLPTIDHKTIENFNPNFAINIIRGSIFKLEEAHDFISSLLIHLKSEEKFDVLKHILTEFKQKYWSDKEVERAARRKLNKFIHTLYNKYMEAEDPDRKFVPQLSSLFKSVFSLSETFEEWVLLSLMIFKDETPDNCAKVLSELNHLLAEKYEKFAITLLAVAVSSCGFKHTFKTDNEKIKLCHALFSSGGSIEDYLLILRLLPKKEPKDTEHYTLYEEIYTKLSQMKEEVVQLQFNLYLKSDTSADKVTDWGKPRPRICRRRRRVNS